MGWNYRAHGVPIHEEEKTVQIKNQHNYSNFSTPNNIRLMHVGVEGVNFLEDCLNIVHKYVQ